MILVQFREGFRHVHVGEFGACGVESLYGVVGRRTHGFVGVLREISTDNADARRARQRVDAVFSGGDVCTERIHCVFAGHGRQDEGRIGDRACDGTRMVKFAADGQDSSQADAAEGGFQTHETAIRGGTTDGAAGLGAQGGGTHTRRDRGCGAAAGAAGRMVGVPRVPGFGRIETCKGRGHRFAKDDGAGCAQAFNHRCIFFRYQVVEFFCASGGRQAFHVDDVLDSHRDSVQGTAVPAAGEFFLKTPRAMLGPFPVDVDPGVQAAVEGVDLRKTGLQQLQGRKTARPDFRGGAGYGKGMRHGGIASKHECV